MRRRNHGPQNNFNWYGLLIVIGTILSLLLLVFVADDMTVENPPSRYISSADQLESDWPDSLADIFDRLK